jgi:hypothetical protein
MTGFLIDNLFKMSYSRILGKSGKEFYYVRTIKEFMTQLQKYKDGNTKLKSLESDYLWTRRLAPETKQYLDQRYIHTYI